MISFKALYVKRNDNGIFNMLQTRPKIYQDEENIVRNTDWTLIKTKHLGNLK